MGGETLTQIRRVAQSLGLKVVEVDAWSAQLIRVDGREGSALFGGGPLCAYPINNATAVSIARDKTHTTQVLQASGIRCVKGEYVFLRPDKRGERPKGREREDAAPMAEELGYPVMVKPNNGSRGRHVFRVENPTQLSAALSAIERFDAMARIERCLNGSEFRVLVFDGRVRYAFRKKALAVTGDGQSTLDTLLEAAGLGETARESFSAHHDLARIPMTGQVVEIPAANIAAGGAVDEFTLAVPDSVTVFAKRVADAMNLRLAGIDVFAPTLNGVEHGGVVLEVNGNPSLGTAAQRFPAVVDAIWQEILTELAGG